MEHRLKHAVGSRTAAESAGFCLPWLLPVVTEVRSLDSDAMVTPIRSLFETSFLASELDPEFQAFKGGPDEAALLDRLRSWVRRQVRGETEIEAAFIGRFFEDTWGYRPDGHGDSWTLQQQFAVPGAGAGGQGGSADLALGYFGAGTSGVPQVLCEFKGVGADLDRPQNRKGNTRSPARQALDYLTFARRGYFDNAAVLPRFALVTDMNQFRLYWYDAGPDAYIEFRIEAPQQGAFFDGGHTLLGETDADAFDRFLFWQLLRPTMLLGEYGRTRLERLIERQGARQKRLEDKFYEEYRDYRKVLYDNIKLQPLDGASARDKLRVAQKLLDRLVFVMFTEDMGGRVAFPPHLLRDMLARESMDRFYEPQDTRIWQNLRRLFQTMDEGGAIGDDTIHRFNGGLFEPDPLIDRLELPNHLFCVRGQARNEATVAAEKNTLLYLSTTYNFAADGDTKNSLGLYTLGHIFEQSLIDLEILEAEAENRLSLSVITKRKRDGVYYTPEHIVRRIIDETIGTLLRRWRAEAGWREDEEPTGEALEGYWQRLRDIRVVDPACGSGAFLISAYAVLFGEMRRILDLRRVLRLGNIVEDAQLARDILANNLYGVDINPLSVEITQLSLWLHTARAREPLSRFTHTVRVGNSLVDPNHIDSERLEAATVERLAPFDWHDAFPEVFARGGFDAVIGNPPYVKLQHFRRVYAETADYLRDGRDDEGEPFYRSTQTGNYDLYLPFIERGLSLLNDGGRMGYIAPNLWPTLEYGAGLRQLVVEGRQLERWIDFRAHQVFEEATIYTAIQIFSSARNDAVAVAFARDGDLAKVDWRTPDATIPYGEFDEDGEPWLFAPAAVRTMMQRLATTCRRLDDPSVTRAIFQGLITSADYIYHLQKLGRNRYLHTPPKVGKVQPPAFEVTIEDAIMKPLVSGAEAKRFIAPSTDTYLLFPYEVDEDGARLWTSAEMDARFPSAWTYLRRFERELRGRENDGFHDDQWYRFGRNQNIDKQETPKLVVPRLVPALRVCIDERGETYCDNVDVGGVLPAAGTSLSFLGGVLGAPTADLLFRWLSKPFRGDYLSANRQFIAPLPVPPSTPRQTTQLGGVATSLQAKYTERLRLRDGLAERLSTLARRKRLHEWLLPDVLSKRAIEDALPRRVGPDKRREVADQQQAEQIESAIGRIDALLRPGCAIEATHDDGAIRLSIDGTPAMRAFVDDDLAPFMLAQWQAIALGFEPNGRGNGKKLIDALRSVAEEAPAVVRAQVIERQRALSALAIELRDLETELHELTCRLYDLTPEERRLVEAR